MDKRTKLLFLSMFVSVYAMASNTSVKNNDGVEIWYDFDSSTKTASVTYKGNSGESYSNEYTGEVVIPSTVTYEGVEYSVTSIGDYAFRSCTSLTSITLPEGLTSIGNYAFRICSALTSITIPEGVTSIGKSAFSKCYALTSITLPESLTSIGDETFDGCRSLTSIILPEGVTSIGDYAFRSCYSLTSITIPEGVTSIGEYAFSGCDALTSITLPESLTTIGNYAFSNCDALTSITIPEGVTSIGEYAFSSCDALTSITLPESLTTIGNYAFSNCDALTSITIPEGLTSIGVSAFSECFKLYEVYNKSNLTITAGSTDNGYVARYAKNVYTDSEGESKLKTVGDYLFYVDGEDIELIAYTGSETSITLPSDYEGKNYNIGDYAFYECDALTSITLPEGGVTSIGKSAFSKCYALTSITLPESLTSIGDETFDGCRSLTSIILPEGVTSIGDYAFRSCYSLTSITIPEGVTSIGNYAFYNCDALTSITIPEGLTSIGVSAFSECSALRTIYVLATNPPELLDDTFPYVLKILVPSESVEKYKTAEFWKVYENKIQGINVISSAEDIINLATLLSLRPDVFEGAIITLTEDIDYATADSAALDTLKRIGTAETPFNGTFDGGGHVIKNLKVNSDSDGSGAFFGVIGKGAEVKNLHFENVEVRVNEIKDEYIENDTIYLGIFADKLEGTLTNVSFIGNILIEEELTTDKEVQLCFTSEGTDSAFIDHAFVYILDKQEEQRPDSNKACIVIKQHIGIGRRAKRTRKTCSNRRTRKVLTIDPDKDLSDEATADINSEYREFTDEEFMSGEVAYWLNYAGKGYTGEYIGDWTQGELYPIYREDNANMLVKIVYTIEGNDDISFTAPTYANVGSDITMTYDEMPLSIKVDNLDISAASIGASETSITVPSTIEPIVNVVMLYYEYETSINVIYEGDVIVTNDGTRVNIEGAEGEMVGIVSLRGIEVMSKRAESDNMTILLPQSGVYIVTVGDKSFKVAYR